MYESCVALDRSVRGTRQYPVAEKETIWVKEKPRKTLNGLLGVRGLTPVELWRTCSDSTGSLYPRPVLSTCWRMDHLLWPPWGRCWFPWRCLGGKHENRQWLAERWGLLNSTVNLGAVLKLVFVAPPLIVRNQIKRLTSLIDEPLTQSCLCVIKVTTANLPPFRIEGPESRLAGLRVDTYCRWGPKAVGHGFSRALSEMAGAARKPMVQTLPLSLEFEHDIANLILRRIDHVGVLGERKNRAQSFVDAFYGISLNFLWSLPSLMDFNPYDRGDGHYQPQS